MNKKDKELLIKDLCARLPYRVLFMVYDNEINEPVELLSINPKRDKPLEIDDGYDENSSTYWNLEDVKPYLRPMSSMAVDEWLELKEWIFVSSDTKGKIYFDGFRNISAEDTVKAIDYLISHYFDYRGLIEKGLALEAPEGMYEVQD